MVDYLRRGSDSKRHAAVVASVVLLHVLVVYALLTGLAKKVVEVVRAPIQTKIIEEARRPPPEPVPLVNPKFEAPPLPFIPPPEVRIAQPQAAPAITAVTTPPPSAAPVRAPTAPAVEAAASAPAVSAAVVCSNYRSKMGEAVFPREARRLGLDKGDALIQFTLSASGEVKNVKALSASHPVFARSSMRVVNEYKCTGQGHEVVVTVPFGYRIE